MEKTKWKYVGKRFSRREILDASADEQVYGLEKINWNDVFSASTITSYRNRAAETLRAHGVDVDALLSDSPHGSAVRDFVLNHEDSERDSLPGLASSLLEVTLHILAYQSMSAPAGVQSSYAYRFGRLSMLFDVYELDRLDHANRRAGKPSSDPYDSGRNDRLRAFHARLIAAGETDATSQTAIEFGLSVKQVGRIVKQKGT